MTGNIFAVLQQKGGGQPIKSKIISLKYILKIFDHNKPKLF